MIDSKDIGLIEPWDEQPPDEFRVEVKLENNQIEIPMKQAPFVAILLLTIGLAIVGTPLCFLLWLSPPTPPMSPSTTAFRLFVAVAWCIGVLGPAAFWYLWPNGLLRPDHWIRYDRDSRVLSIRGGWSTFHREEIVCFLAVTDVRRRKRRTELQVLTLSEPCNAKHFVAHCRVTDPELAFGSVMTQFATFSDIPCFVATIDVDGRTNVSGCTRLDKQADN